MSRLTVLTVSTSSSAISAISRFVATLDEVREHNYALTPGRFVGSANGDDDEDESFDERLKRLTIELDAQFRESAELELLI